jgi:hypothetical protein
MENQIIDSSDGDEEIIVGMDGEVYIYINGVQYSQAEYIHASLLGEIKEKDRQ